MHHHRFPRLYAAIALVCLVRLLHAGSVSPVLDSGIDRPWIGPDFWANPMEDWRLLDGIATNTHSGGDRELVLLTAELNDQASPFLLRAVFSPVETKAKAGFVGFQLGLRGQFADYRDSAIYGSGLAAGIDVSGRMFIGAGRSEKPLVSWGKKPLKLELSGAPTADGRFDVTLSATAAGEEPVQFLTKNVHASWLPGLVSFTVSSAVPNRAVVREPRPAEVPKIAQNRAPGWRFGVSGMHLEGPKVEARPERAFGPLLWTQHSLQHGKLVMTAQFAPVDSPEKAKLVVDGLPPAEAAIDPHARVARFIVDGLDPAKDHPYTVSWGGASFQGVVRAEPSAKPALNVAAMSCNDATGFPHTLLVANVKAQQPDLIAFLGDQIYEGIGGYGLIFGENNTEYDDRAMLSYLRKYAMHGWTWRDILRDVPSITIPDDHDVFHGNVWGCGGKLADRSKDLFKHAQDSGGYKMSAAFVNAVTLTQTGNLPEPVDPAPCANGIKVYFTSWDYAGINMAVLADRQFKSAPKALLPTSRIENGWPENHDMQRPALTEPRQLDSPEAELLGDRQEAFLSKWTDSRPADARWRLVFSQTPLMCLQTLPESEYSDSVVPKLPRMKPGEYPENDIPKLDYDSNGWPQTKRDLTAALITRAGAVHVTGDQHLGSTGQYGIKDFDDAAWWISSPAIANVWPRRWFPRGGGAMRRDGDPMFTGRFEDGFGNRITLHAASNPVDIDREPSQLFDKGVGYAMLTLDRPTGHVKLAIWPYWAGPDAASPDNRPYPGWPITIDPATHRRIR